MNYDGTRIKGGTDNCYLISDGRNAMLVDTSSGASLEMVIRPQDHFFVSEGDTFEQFGFPDVKVVELPGHMRGSIGLLVGDDKFIAGDALDNWITPVMGHLYYDKEVQKKTFEKIRSYKGRTAYYGHGRPTVLKWG